MDRNTEISLIKEIIGLSEMKSTFLDDQVTHSPISRYSSPDRFERENAMIFRRKPMVVAHSTELVEDNSYIAKNFLGLPVLLTRDADGQPHAFLNVCRHRGARLERNEAGCKRLFVCPYHAWSWTNTGELRGVPHEAQGFPDLSRAERNLRRLPVTEAYGFIWIIANPETADMPQIDTWLSGLNEDLDWLGLDNHKIAVIEEREIAANWKLLVEGGIEAYHFRVAHKNTIAPFFPDNLSTYRIFDTHIRSVLPRITLTDLKAVPETEWSIRQDANVLYVIMPNTQLLVQQDHIVWIQSEPIDQGRTKMRLATLVPNDTPETEDLEEHWKKNHSITMTTLMEDFELGEEVQSGFASRGNPSHLFGRFEGALNRFNLAVEEMIAT